MSETLARLRRWLDTAMGLWFQRLIAAWCGLGILLLLTQEGDFWDLSFAQTVPWYMIGGMLVLLTLLPALADRLWPRAHITSWYLLALGGGLPLVLAIRYSGPEPLQMAAALIVFWLLLLGFAMACPFLFDRCPLSRRASGWMVGVLGLLAALFIGGYAAIRYLCFYVPNYDGGLFTQMFHYMRTTGLPLTTCERDGLLSHFAVHISPVFYLLLPFYMLTGGHPLTLGIGQAVVLVSGLIPLYLLCRDKKLSPKLTVVLALAYCAYPALTGGTFYDIHENCFLTPLLLWLFWCGESDNKTGLLISAILVLSVKEDAAVFLAIYALYVLVAQKKYLRGGLMLVAAVSWFLLAVWLLNTYGDGVLMGRYGSLMYGEQGLLPMVKTLLVNPGYALRQLFLDEHGGAAKLRYLLQMLVGVGFLPFITKKPVRLLLTAPILLNLLTSYVYLHEIGFQYNFAVIAFFFYAAVLNLKDMQKPTRRFFTLFAAGAAVLMCITAIWPTIRSDMNDYRQNHEKYAHMEQILSEIPRDAPVTASTFLVAHLADREVLYEDYYHQGITTEYLILDIRAGLSEKAEALKAQYLEAGYTVWAEYPGELLILHTDTPIE